MSAIRKMRREVLEENDLAKNQIVAMMEMRKADLKGQSPILKIGDQHEAQYTIDLTPLLLSNF